MIGIDGNEVEECEPLPDGRVAERAARGRVVERGVVGRWVADYLALTKIRLSSMVVVTTAVGFVVGSFGGIDWAKLLWTVTGTLLAAMGASAFNQAMEAGRDGKMERTRGRPVPAGRMSRKHAALAGLWMSVAGVAILCPTSNGMTAVLGLVNILIYVLIYTPLKPVSTVNTLVGGVVGAIPPVMGYVAAAGGMRAEAWLLGALLFMWQVPHFLALAWMYRVDYARGGYRMLPAVDGSGRLTALFSILYSLALIPIGAVMYLAGTTGKIFVVGAAVLGAWLFLRAVVFLRDRSDAAARKLFLCSVTYLPVLLMVMVADARHPREEKYVQPGAAVIEAGDEMTAERFAAVKAEAERAGATLPGAKKN